jgi:hypothetical protein
MVGSITNLTKQQHSQEIHFNMIATTKNEVMAYKEEGVRYTYDKEMMNTLFGFMHDIGAKNELPYEKDKIQKYLIRLHEVLMVENNMIPDDIPFTDIYPQFMMDVIYNKAKRHGNNISAIAYCFNEWFKINADKYLIKKDFTKETKSTKLEAWDDKTIHDLYQTVVMLTRNNMIDGIWKMKGGDSFFGRLKTEFHKRYEEA